MNILLRIVFLILAMFTLTITEAEAQTLIITQEDNFVKHLESRFNAALAAEQKGDAAAYKSLRTTEIVRFMENYLREQNELQNFSQWLKETYLLEDEMNLKLYNFVKCEKSDNISRLVYSREEPQSRDKFLVIMFRNEEGSWRIGNYGTFNLRQKDKGAFEAELAGKGKKTAGSILEDNYDKFQLQ